MPHGLGSPRDFGIDVGPGDPEPQAQGNLRRIEDELAQQNAEAANLGPAEDAPEDPWAEAEVGEYLGGEAVEGSPEEMEQLMQYLQMMQPAYNVTPTDLAVLKNEGIITVDEARAYLAGKGVIDG